MSVSLILVSHSKQLAAGLAELAAQMARDVNVIPVGGRDDGAIGTSFDLIEEAISAQLDSGKEVLVLTDLGSATMTVESVLEFIADDAAFFVAAPFVEGTIAAAVAAQSGKGLRECAQVAAQAADSFNAPQVAGVAASAAESATYARTVIVADSVGLHARPAARIAQMAAATDGAVLLNGEPADSLLKIMTLGINHGEEVTISTVSAQFQQVVDEIADAISAGLDG
ncbi:dihydroxyacetone kinase phosphoryl donor subunit DhaM [Arcanobacterium hippocoleae]|uniref:Phosphocarrier protein HPr n=1 Tax=Arcanobacterium hippocoleae TaxID=149017 RepID=A0ABU1T127_9ACTO|nr:dihydroxyacetone kinase phosphoryl donor subunit DhaM [Arcanobacterium hippocoleae]MDR6939043.1 PTS hybrid protein [Arcanobacterium hippocoleae]